MRDAFQFSHSPNTITFLQQGNGILILFFHLIIGLPVADLPSQLPSIGYILLAAGVEPVLNVGSFDVGEFGKYGDNDTGKGFTVPSACSE